MSKIIGNTTTTPVPRSDWEQVDKTKADFIRHKPTLGTIAEKDAADYYTKFEADSKIADLINGAPTTLDTLGEIATAMAENADVVAALDAAIGSKADKSEIPDIGEITNDEINEICNTIVYSTDEVIL